MDDRSPVTRSSRERCRTLAIIGLWVLITALPIGSRGLWAPDEPRYTQVSWEMAQSGQLLVPLLNSELYTHKPPLFFWLTILAAGLTGFETASRWVAALSSLGVILLARSMARRSGGDDSGFTAALMLMSCWLFAQLSATGNIDILFTLAVTASLYAYFRWEGSDRSAWLVIAYTMAGLGVLAKGPAAILITWLVFVLRELSAHRGQPGRRWHHLLWGPLISLGVAALWVVPACLAGGAEYARTLLITQNVGRAVGSFAHQKPWYYFLVNFPLLSLPWFLLLPAALTDFRKSLGHRDRRTAWFALWFIVVFVFFSLVSGKRGRYLLPAFPPLCIYLAHAVGRWDTRKLEPSRSIRVVWAVVAAAAGLILLLPPAVPLLSGVLPGLELMAAEPADWRLWGFYAAGAAAVFTLWKAGSGLRTGRQSRTCRMIALAFLLLSVSVQLHLVPRLDSVKSVRRAAAQISSIAGADSTIAFLGKRSDKGWNYYLGRPSIPVVGLSELEDGSATWDILIEEVSGGRETPPTVPGYEPLFMEDLWQKHIFVLRRLEVGPGFR